MEFFVVTKDRKSLHALKYWLRKHRYNSWSLSGKDKNGNEMIPIRWDRAPDSDWGKPEKATGIVIIKDKSLYDEAEAIIKEQSGRD